MSILKEGNYSEIVQSLIQETLADYVDKVDKISLWELIKIRIKEASIKYCRERQLKQSNAIKQLVETIHSLDKKIQSNPVSEAFMTERHFAKEKLDVLYKDKAIGAQIRSRVRWIEEGERSTSYFLGVENYRQSYNLTRLTYKVQFDCNSAEPLPPQIASPLPPRLLQNS